MLKQVRGSFRYFAFVCTDVQGKSHRPYFAFEKVLFISLTVRRSACAVDGLDVVRLAEDPVVGDAEFLPRGELSLAGVAGEAGEVVDLLLGLAHPVGGGDHAAALEALGAEHLGVVDLAVEAVLAQEAAGVRVHDGVADAAAQALRVPRPVRHLEDVPVRDDLPAEGALVAL